MKKKKYGTMIKGLIVLLLAVLFIPQSVMAAKFVKTYEDGGRDTNTGDSWDQAYLTIQYAYAANAMVGTTNHIYVAEGTHLGLFAIYLDELNLYSSTDVSIIGGFPANSTGVDVSNYDYKANKTIIKKGFEFWELFHKIVLKGFYIEEAIQQKRHAGTDVTYEDLVIENAYNAAESADEIVTNFTMKNVTYISARGLENIHASGEVNIDGLTYINSTVEGIIRGDAGTDIKNYTSCGGDVKHQFISRNGILNIENFIRFKSSGFTTIGSQYRDGTPIPKISYAKNLNHYDSTGRGYSFETPIAVDGLFSKNNYLLAAGYQLYLDSTIKSTFSNIIVDNIEVNGGIVNSTSRHRPGVFNMYESIKTTTYDVEFDNAIFSNIRAYRSASAYDPLSFVDYKSIKSFVNLEAGRATSYSGVNGGTLSFINTKFSSTGNFYATRYLLNTSSGTNTFSNTDNSAAEAKYATLPHECTYAALSGSATTTTADDDNDTVPNTLDACPNTPAGGTVGANGCPADTDLSIVKTASVSNITTGVAFKYVLTIKNKGSEAHNVKVGDAVSGDLTINSVTVSNGGTDTTSGQDVAAQWDIVPAGATRKVIINVTKN